MMTVPQTASQPGNQTAVCKPDVQTGRRHVKRFRRLQRNASAAPPPVLHRRHLLSCLQTRSFHFHKYFHFQPPASFQLSPLTYNFIARLFMASVPSRSTFSHLAMPRRRSYRPLPRRGRFVDADADPSSSTVPAATTSLASLTPPRHLPRVRPPLPPALAAASASTTVTRTRRRRRSGLLASSSAAAVTATATATASAAMFEDRSFSYQPPKKRRIEEYEHPQGATKPLRLTLAYCDGGTYEAEKYRVSNMLADDESVYCTEHYSCNLVLQHETKQPFTLEWLEIKAPPQGFTSPVSEGVVAVTEDDYNPVVARIALYGRSLPLKKRARMAPTMYNAIENDNDDGEVEIRYRVLRGDDDDDGQLEGQIDEDERRDDDGENEQEEEGGDEYFLDGERVTEFDVRREDADEEDKDDEETEELENAVAAAAAREQQARADARAVGEAAARALEAATASDQEDDESVSTPVPWQVVGSRRIPRTTGLELGDDNPHDCPYDLPGEDDTEMEVAVWESDEDSMEEELRLWLRRNSGAERRSRRRHQQREEEEEAEREYAQSEADNEETYMRFQLRDNKTYIVFDPPRYCRSIVLKLWGAKIDNVDIQAVLGYGYFGKRVFPAVEMR
ncbi:hypothetical protein TWF696_005902 [Orbilia brochopaga]|uniref:Uncharacterized protein n=1 Tax=Orbilia brochopaga TaxID=3140254 RepID=A0AAV9UVV9_9PEZI